MVEICQHFKDYENFTISGYDYISCNGSISQDISKLPESDDSTNICIFSKSLMDSNWKDYLQEG